MAKLHSTPALAAGQSPEVALCVLKGRIADVDACQYAFDDGAGRGSAAELDALAKRADAATQELFNTVCAGLLLDEPCAEKDLRYVADLLRILTFEFRNIPEPSRFVRAAIDSHSVWTPRTK